MYLANIVCTYWKQIQKWSRWGPRVFRECRDSHDASFAIHTNVYNTVHLTRANDLATSCRKHGCKQQLRRQQNEEGRRIRKYHARYYIALWVPMKRDYAIPHLTHDTIAHTAASTHNLASHLTPSTQGGRWAATDLTTQDFINGLKTRLELWKSRVYLLKHRTVPTLVVTYCNIVQAKSHSVQLWIVHCSHCTLQIKAFTVRVRIVKLQWMTCPHDMSFSVLWYS